MGKIQTPEHIREGLSKYKSNIKKLLELTESENVGYLLLEKAIQMIGMSNVESYIKVRQKLIKL